MQTPKADTSMWWCDRRVAIGQPTNEKEAIEEFKASSLLSTASNLVPCKKEIGVASSCLQKNSAAFWVLILYLRVSFWLEKGSRVRGSEATGQRKKKNYYEQTKTTIIMKKIFNESGL